MTPPEPLKPCPFCGGKAQAKPSGFRNCSIVECSECLATTAHIIREQWPDARAAAIAAWNRRAEEGRE